MAGRDDVRAAQRQERGPGAGVSPGPFQRGFVREQHAQPRPPSLHAPRNASSDRSVPVSSRSSSMRAAARWFATRRRAAFTVATLLVVPSSSLASDSASSSRSTTVLDIRSSTIGMSADETIVYQMEREERYPTAAHRCDVLLRTDRGLGCVLVTPIRRSAGYSTFLTSCHLVTPRRSSNSATRPKDGSVAPLGRRDAARVKLVHGSRQLAAPVHRGAEARGPAREPRHRPGQATTAAPRCRPRRTDWPISRL